MVINRSERTFQTLIEHSSDGMAILSSTGKTVYTSPSIKNILGYTPEEAILLDLFTLAHPDTSSYLLDRTKEAMKNIGVPITGKPVLMKHKDGSSKWIDGEIIDLLHDQDIKGLVYNFRDVTEKVLAEKYIQESEEKYRSFFDNSPDGILLTVPDGHVFAANPAACVMFQMTEKELCGKDRMAVIDTSDPRVIAAIRERQRVGKVKAEMNFVRKDGSKFIGEVSSAVFTDAYGVQKTSVIIRDMTERKEAEQLLLESELFNKGILSSLLAHIAVVDLTGNIVAVNKAWEDFGREVGPVCLARIPKGSNLFEMRKKAIIDGDPFAQQALEGIHAVFNREKEVFELEYPCHSPGKQRWFILQVMKFGSDGSKVVLSHQDITERKVAEQKLKESEEKLREAQAVANIGSWETDLQTMEVKWSEQNYRIFETSPAGIEPSHEGFLTFVHEEDREKVNEAFLKSFAGEGSHCIEHRVTLANKTEKILEERWRIIKSETGIPIRASGTCQDITERKRAAELVARSEANLTAVVENSEAAIFSLDRDFRYITFNKLLVANLKDNYNLEIKKGGNAYDFLEKLPPAEAREWYEVYSRALAGEVVKFEKDFHINSKRFVTSFSLHPIWENGEVTGLSCFALDVTKQKQSAEKLSKSEFRYRQIVETAQEGIWVIDREDKTIFVNRKMCEILGYTRNEMIGKTNLFFKDPQSFDTAVEILKKRRHGIMETHESTFITKSGGRVYAHVSTNPIFGEDGVYKGSLAMVADITGEKKLEMERERMTADLLQRNKELEQFSYIVSHNLRAPVANIIGLSEELSHPTYSDDVKEMFNKELSSNVNRLNNVIVDLNEIIQTKQQASQKTETIILSDLVDNIRSSIQNIIQKEQVQIKTDFEEANKFRTIRSYLHSIFYNLISNSIKFHQPGIPPEIFIRTHKQGDALIINFRDNGRGIDLSTKGDQVFGLYKRFHTSIEGKGMGLFMVKTQVEALGGKIILHSELNKGSEFVIEFKNVTQP